MHLRASLCDCVYNIVQHICSPLCTYIDASAVGILLHSFGQPAVLHHTTHFGSYLRPGCCRRIAHRRCRPHATPDTTAGTRSECQIIGFYGIRSIVSTLPAAITAQRGKPMELILTLIPCPLSSCAAESVRKPHGMWHTRRTRQRPRQIRCETGRV